MLALAVALLAGIAEGSVLRAFTLGELRSGSEAIVSGRVLGVRSIEAGGTIDTIARIRVTETWRGFTGRTIRVRVPGGQAAGRRLVVAGAPGFRKGDTLLLFLYPDGREWRPVGLFQGVWHLDAGDPGMARASSSGGASLLRPEAGTVAVDRNERPLSQLLGGGAQ